MSIMWKKILSLLGSVLLVIGAAQAHPTILTPLNSQAVIKGDVAAFAVTAEGVGSLAYQWNKNGVPLPGATNSYLQIDPAGFTDAGSYTVDVSDDTGSISSAPADLLVNGLTAGDLDKSFNRMRVGVYGYAAQWGGNINAMALQGDGKVVIAGDFTTVNDVRRGRIARLNPDGSLDMTFQSGMEGANGEVFSLALQSDGKIIVGGGFTAVNGVMRGRLARLNRDGSLDTTFLPGLSGPNGVVYTIVPQSDGKILLGGAFSSINGISRTRIARLNADGMVDTTFQEGLAGADNTINAIVVQNDGKVIIAGGFTTVNGASRGRIARLNADGSLDTMFLNGLAGANGGVRAVGVQSDGKVVIGGDFSTVNGTGRNRIARLNADGSLDTTFQNGMSGGYDWGVYCLAIQSNGKIVIGGAFIRINGTNRGKIARLNADGSLDTTFQNGMAGADNSGQNAWVNAVIVQGDGKVLIGGYAFFQVNGIYRFRIARLNTDGAVDRSFQEGFVGASGGGVTSIGLQPDGKIVMGGGFSSISQTNRGRIVRVNADGSLDTSFQNGMAGANGTVWALALQGDGKVVIGGNFTTVNGTSRNRIARLNADGSLDTTFQIGTGLSQDGYGCDVYALAVQPDGKILAAGTFNLFNGTTRTRIVRLNTDGTLDTAFLSGLSGANDTIYALAVQNDGKILVAGRFSTINGYGRTRIARLNADGSVDTAFLDGLAGANNTVWTMALQADGKVLIGGDFTTINGTGRNRLARLNEDGSLDTSFLNGMAGLNYRAMFIMSLSDDKSLIGGYFDTVNGTGRSRIARLNADGSVDSTFYQGITGPDAVVRTMAVQADGNIVVGGDFTSFNSRLWYYFARLLGTGDEGAPLVSAPTATVNGFATATLGATIADEAGVTISARGTLWGLESLPMFNVLSEGGVAAGEFSHARMELPRATMIYYRGYATSDDGKTAFSPDGTFWTIPLAPEVVSPWCCAATYAAYAMWKKSASATGYQVDVAWDAAFQNYVPGYENLSIGDSESCWVTGLTAGVTYYYRVRAVNSGGASENSATMAGEAFPAPPLASGATGINPDGFTANWTAIGGATNFLLDVATQSSFTGYYVPGYQDLAVGAVQQQPVTGLTLGQTYYYRVRAQNSAGTSGYSETIVATVIIPTTLSSSIGPFAGGNVVTITGGPLGNGADITQVMVGGVAATILSQDVHQVTFIMSAAGSAGVKDIIIQSTSVGETTIAGAYTVNPAGEIGAVVEDWTKWEEVTGLPANRKGLAAGVLNGALYAMGGMDPYYNSTTNVYRYDGTTWTEVAGLPAARYDLGAGELNGSLYAVGGVSESNPNVYRYDGTTWTTVVGLPQGRARPAVGALNGVLYTIGGMFQGSYKATVYQYDGTAWTEGAALPATRMLLGAGAINGALYAVGGNYSGANTNVYQYDGTTWTEVAGLPVARYGHGVGVLNGALYVVGGSDGMPTNNVYRYDGTNWTEVAGLPASRYGLGLGVLNGALYAIGGESTTWESQTNVYRYPGRAIGPGVSPASGSYAGGYPVVIIGANLGDGSDVTSVTICGVPVAGIVSQSATQIVVVAGAGTAGLGDVRVYSTSFGETVTSNAFTYIIPLPGGPVAGAASDITNTSFAANWSAAADASNYRLDVATDAAFTSYVAGYQDLSVGNTLACPVSGLSAGTVYYYRVRAQNSGGTSAHSETVTVVTSSEPTRRPDLSVTSVSFDPAVLARDITFTAVVTVVNNGAAPADAGVLRVWANLGAAANPGDPGDASLAVGVLEVGASRTITFTGLRTPATNGTYRFRAFVDADDATVESSEGNNQKTVSYSFSAGSQPKPDFSVTSVSFNPAVLARDIEFSAMVTIANNSETAADAGLLKVWAARATTAIPGDPGDQVQTIGMLAAGESRVVTFNGLRTPATNGTYKFRAYVDADDVVLETSEGNNQKAVSYSLSAGSQPKPDFAVSSISFDPAVLARDIAFTALVTVVNSGSVTADAGLLNVWVTHATTANPGEVGDALQTVGALEPGESRVFTFTGLRTPTTNGNYKFRAFVDAANAAVETSEGNNQKAVSYSFSAGYQPKPDFLITEIAFSPESPLRGNPFTAYVTVKNQGAVAADAGYLDVWVSKSTSAQVGDTGDAWQGVGPLNVDQSVQLIFDGLLAPTNGTRHTFRGFVDSHGAVTESSEGNNQATKTINY